MDAPSGLKGARSNLIPWALGGLWVVTATVFQLVRVSDPPVWRAIWAEDGHFFLNQALDQPFALLDPHSGYLQLAARTVAMLAALLPFEDAAATFAVAGSFVVALLSVHVYFASASVLETTWARALMAVTFVFGSVTAFEVSANGLDLHWYLLFACFWALWSTSESTPALVADSVVVAVATLSGPLTVLYTPLALRRLLSGGGLRRWPGPRQWIVPAVFGAAAAAQALTVVLSRRGEQRFSDFNVIDVPLVYSLRVTGSVLVGDRFLDEAWLRFGWYFALGSLALVGGVCLYGMIRARGQRLAFMIAAVTYSGLIFTVSLFLRGSTEMRLPRDTFLLNGSRYTVVPVLLLCAALLVVAEGPPVLGQVWLPRGVAVGLALVTVVSFHWILPVRVYAPDWRTSVHTARRQCAETRADSVRIPIAPGPPDAWYVVMPCDR